MPKTPDKLPLAMSFTPGRGVYLLRWKRLGSEGGVINLAPLQWPSEQRPGISFLDGQVEPGFEVMAVGPGQVTSAAAEVPPAYKKGDVVFPIGGSWVEVFDREWQNERLVLCQEEFILGKVDRNPKGKGKPEVAPPADGLPLQEGNAEASVPAPAPQEGDQASGVIVTP